MYRTDLDEQPSAAKPLRLAEDQTWPNADDTYDTGPLPGIAWLPEDEVGAAGRPRSAPRHRHAKNGPSPTLAAAALIVAGVGVIAVFIGAGHRGSADRGSAAGRSSRSTSTGAGSHAQSAAPNLAHPSGAAPSRSTPPAAPQPGEAVATIAAQQPIVPGTTKHGNGYHCMRNCGWPWTAFGHQPRDRWRRPGVVPPCLRPGGCRVVP
jgi:hypothetical protein